MPGPVVTEVEVNDWKKDDGSVVKVSNVVFADGTKAPGYDLPPGIEAGKPLPDGWEVATSKSGKPYIKVPKAGKGGFGGGAPAFRNTREGFLLEQESIHRSVALQRAVEAKAAKWDSLTSIEEYADRFYAWLRATSTTAVGQPTGEKTGNGSSRARPTSGGGSTYPTFPMNAAGGIQQFTTSGSGAGGKLVSDPGNTSEGQSSGRGDEGSFSPQSSPADQAGEGQVSNPNGEEAAPAPPSGDCTHPSANRKPTASGKVRCTVCGKLVS